MGIIGICGHEIRPVDRIVFRFSRKCKVCHERDVASIDYLRQCSQDTERSLDDRLAFWGMIAEIENIEKDIQEYYRRKLSSIPAKEENERSPAK